MECIRWCRSKKQSQLGGMFTRWSYINGLLHSFVAPASFILLPSIAFLDRLFFFRGERGNSAVNYRPCFNL